MYLVKVTHVCIITPQFATMQEFYSHLLHLEPKQFQADYVETEPPGAIVSLYEEASFAQIAPAAVPKPGTGGVMLELQVVMSTRNSDACTVSALIWQSSCPPTTFPWGNRSIYLRGPRRQSHKSYSPVPAP